MKERADDVRRKRKYGWYYIVVCIFVSFTASGPVFTCGVAAVASRKKRELP
jgi:hypothetical protein